MILYIMTRTNLAFIFFRYHVIVRFDISKSKNVDPKIRHLVYYFAKWDNRLSNACKDLLVYVYLNATSDEFLRIESNIRGIGTRFPPPPGINCKRVLETTNDPIAISHAWL